jgi:hypothetical protein
MTGTCDQARGTPVSADASAVVGEGTAEQVTALKSAGKTMEARKRWKGFVFRIILGKRWQFFG